MSERFVPPDRQPKTGMPGKVAVRHMIEAAKAAGLDPAGFRAFPDGSVEVFEARALPQEDSLFDTLEQAGKL